jgi:hypothetical protein
MAERFAVFAEITVRGPLGDFCEYCEWILTGRTSRTSPVRRSISGPSGGRIVDRLGLVTGVAITGIG